MTGSEKVTVPASPFSRSRWGRVGKYLSSGLMLMIAVIGITAAGLMLADYGMNHPRSYAALQHWMEETRFGWPGG